MTQDDRSDRPLPAGMRSKLAAIKQLEQDQGPAVAEKALIALVQEYPNSHQAYFALARLLLRQKRYEYAVRAAQKAVELEPLEAKPHTLLGIALMRGEDLAGASAAFAKALELDKSNAQALMGAAAIKMADESYEDALALCDRALELNPSLERAQQLIARINMKQGKPDAAADELRKILDKNGDNDRALRAYMRLMRKEGRLNEVIDLAEDNLANTPASPRAIARYAKIVSFAGEPQRAVAKYRKLLDSTQVRELDRVRFISALIEAGELDEAATAIGDLKERPAMRPLKMKLQGDIAFGCGADADAEKLYIEACQAARVTPPTDDDLKSEEGQAPISRLKSIQHYTAKALRAALRSHRSDKSSEID